MDEIERVNKQTHKIKPMNKVKLYKLILVTALIGCICSCSVENTEDWHHPSTKAYYEGEIKLGEKLKDPYNIAYMEEALAYLTEHDERFPIASISATGSYVRVNIQNEEELDFIEADTSIIWFDFPLDYEVPEGGVSYHDPTLPDSVTWKYAVVPSNYTLPASMTIELIYNVFIPTDCADYEEYYDKLEEYSEQLCGIKTDDSPDDDTLIFPTPIKSNKRSPKASIIAWDDYLEENIPLKGAKVTARYYTKVKKQYTNAEGRCTFPKVFKSKNPIKWAIIWEHDKWDIRNGWGIQQYYNGPKQKSDWTLAITGNKSLMFATIHRGLYKAFYEYWGDLQRPYASHRLKVGYLDSYRGDSTTATTGTNLCSWNVFGLLNNISIYGRTYSGEFRETQDIIETLNHELGHQSMLVFVGGRTTYHTHNSFIRESYACCVGWAMTNDYYQNNLNRTGFQCNIDRQGWKNNGEKSEKYTPIFIDLMDGYCGDQNGYGYVDSISDYSLYEIQTLIIGDSYDLTSLKNTLTENMLHRTTEAAIEALINNYCGTKF